LLAVAALNRQDQQIHLRQNGPQHSASATQEIMPYLDVLDVLVDHLGLLQRQLRLTRGAGHSQQQRIQRPLILLLQRCACWDGRRGAARDERGAAQHLDGDAAQVLDGQ